MRKKIVVLLSLAVLFLIPTAVKAQQIVTITKGQFTRTGGNIVAGGSSIDADFRFTNADSDISGKIDPSAGGAVYTFCDVSGCTIGQTLTIFDNITGRTKLRQGANPVIIGGVSYQTIYYQGELKFEAGKIRIPFYAGRRSTVKLTFPVKLTGNIAGYPNPSFGTPIFSANLSLPGTVTIKLTRQNPGANSPAYQISEISYNLSAIAGN